VSCNGGNIGSATATASGGTGPYTYTWSPSGGTDAAATGLSTGTYTVSVTDATGCSSMNTVTIAGSSSVTAMAGPNSSICAGQIVVLTASGGGDYSWSNGETTASVSVSPVANTTYSVIVSVGTCIDTAFATVAVNPPPVPNFTAPSVCFNNPTTFNNLSTGGTNWIWNLGNGATSTLQNPSVIYNNSGPFIVSLVVDASGCKDSITQTIFVNPLPAANFSAPPKCLGDSTCFMDMSVIAPGSIISWSWNFGDPYSASNISNQQSPCHIFSSSGSFNVLLTVTSDSGCQNNITLPALVTPPPTAAFTSAPGCLGTPTQFTDGSVPSSIASWNWNIPGGTPATSTAQHPATIYNTPGTHTVILVVTATGGCTDTTTLQTLIYNPPVANFSGTVSGCAPVCNQYTDMSTSTDGSITSWVWSFPGGTPAASSIQTPNICYYTPGTYGASLMVATTYGCKDTVAITPLVNVYPWPNADFCVTPASAPATDPVFSFCDLWSSDVVQWNWNFGDGDGDTTNTDPTHSYSATITNNDFYSYNVCINVKNQYGCPDSICHPVEIIPEFTFYIPNTFTPNHDFTNETFFGKSRGVKEYTLMLFDRWGNLIWDCDYKGKNTDWDNQGQDGMSSFCQWDGKVETGGADMSGNSKLLAQEDVYVWKVRLTDVFDKRHTYIGHVNVVR
ncbi:MAG: PKD domain-containing protein, partial [Bacteroidetes bacterium]